MYKYYGDDVLWYDRGSTPPYEYNNKVWALATCPGSCSLGYTYIWEWRASMRIGADGNVDNRGAAKSNENNTSRPSLDVREAPAYADR